MAQEQNPKQECKCDSTKKMKALEKQVAELKGTVSYLSEMLLTLAKEVATLRKAVRQ